MLRGQESLNRCHPGSADRHSEHRTWDERPQSYKNPRYAMPDCYRHEDASSEKYHHGNHPHPTHFGRDPLPLMNLLDPLNYRSNSDKERYSFGSL